MRMKLKRNSRSSVLVALSLCLIAMVPGCGNEAPAGLEQSQVQMPRSLGDLCRAVRAKLSRLPTAKSGGTIDSGADVDAKSVQRELTKLVAWAPELAADCPIDERRWIPIYQLSEDIRQSIASDPDRWDLKRQDRITRLCQIGEDAWRSVPKSQRRRRFRPHDHDHDH